MEMIPVLWRGKLIGRMDLIAVPRHIPWVRLLIPQFTPFSISDSEDLDKPVKSDVVELRIVRRREDDMPTELHATDLRGLLSLPMFHPEDSVLPELIAAQKTA
jgi:hypothetical protein